MRWPATLLGAAAGLALASIPGGLLGGLLGLLLDRHLRLDSWAALVRRLRGSPAAVSDELLFMLLGRLAKADGRVLPAHIERARAEMRRLQLDAAAQRNAIAAFTRGKSIEQGWRRRLLRLRRDPARAEAWLRSCWAMAAVAGGVSPGNAERLRLWGRWMGLDNARLEQLAGAFEVATPGLAADYQAALRLLGVAVTSTPEQVKQAYRRLLSQNHPDKLLGQGASAAEVRAATERTRALHAAFSCIRERQRAS